MYVCMLRLYVNKIRVELVCKLGWLEGVSIMRIFIFG